MSTFQTLILSQERGNSSVLENKATVITRLGVTLRPRQVWAWSIHQRLSLNLENVYTWATIRWATKRCLTCICSKYRWRTAIIILTEISRFERSKSSHVSFRISCEKIERSRLEFKDLYNKISLNQMRKKGYIMRSARGKIRSRSCKRLINTSPIQVVMKWRESAMIWRWVRGKSSNSICTARGN
jgi:hypothetical protein